MSEVSEGPLDRLQGRTVGDYLIGDKLGQGGFGAVFRARQRQLDREVVIKILRPRQGGGEARQRFLRLARRASRFDHPAAAHVYDCGSEPDGLLWIAMELVRGTPLDEYLSRRGVFSPGELAPVFERICEVVQSAHQQGIIHRDLKPANVMVMERAGQLWPTLLGFGIAKAQDEVASITEPELIEPTATLERPAQVTIPAVEPGTTSFFNATQGRTVLGSPFYMAPEQWLDSAAADARTDLYALGVLCYQALSGRHPFTGSTPEQLQRAHATQPVPPLGPGFPPALDAFFRRAMARQPLRDSDHHLRHRHRLARSTFRFASCAEKEAALALAKSTFARVARLSGSRSVFHSILARFHLGRVLLALGEKEAARAQLQDFLSHWEKADHPLPEIEEARKLMISR